MNMCMHSRVARCFGTLGGSLPCSLWLRNVYLIIMPPTAMQRSKKKSTPDAENRPGPPVQHVGFQAALHMRQLSLT